MHGPLREFVHVRVRAEEREAPHAEPELLAQFPPEARDGLLVDLDLPSGELPLPRERLRPRTFHHEHAPTVLEDCEDDGDGDALRHGPRSPPTD